jgi:hypothetical protein
MKAKCGEEMTPIIIPLESLELFLDACFSHFFFIFVGITKY